MNPNGLTINPINPEDLILRFAQRLEFGTETMRVANDAVRIVQRMNRDWMTPGRRPAGICGAALIIAARMNNFRRTPREMVFVVKVNEMTIFKRLDEFKGLESSGLTVDEFRTIDLERFADPPAFQEKDKVKKRRGRKQKHVEFDDDGDDLGASPTPLRGSTEADGPGGSSDRNTSPGTNRQLATPADTQQARLDSQSMPPPPVPIDPHILRTDRRQFSGAEPQTIHIVDDPDSQDEAPHAQSQTAAIIFSSQPEGFARSNVVEKGESTSGPISTETTKFAGSSALNPSTRRKRGRPRKDGLDAAPADEASITATLTDPFTLDASALQSAVDSTIVEDDDCSSTSSPTSQPKATSAISATPIPMTPHIAEDEFDNDPEVNNCLLEPDEVAIKTRIWTSINADWLRFQAAKTLKHEIAVQNGTYKPRKTRQRKRRRIGDLRQYADVLGEGDGEVGMRRLEAGEGFDGAVEAVGAMMKQRAWSSKINYDALKDVYTPSSSQSRRTSIGGAGSPGSGMDAGNTGPMVGGLISPGGTTAVINGRQSGEPENLGQQSRVGTVEASTEQMELDGIVGELEEGGIYDDDGDDDDGGDDAGDAGDDDDPYEAGGADFD